LKLGSKEQQTVREYLLGQATQEDSSRVEELLLTDGAFYEEVLIAEDELIDQYLSDKLSQVETQRFETHFLVAPEHWQKLRFARALQKYVDFAATSEPQEDPAPECLSGEEPDVAKPAAKRKLFWFLPSSSPILSYSLAAATLLIVVGVSWVIFNNWRQQTTHPPGNVYVVTLKPGLVRETGEIRSINVPPGTGSIQLQLGLISNEYQSYRADLLNSESIRVLVKEDLKPESAADNKIINLTVSAGLLKRDDYRVKLSGRRPDGSYEDIAGYVFRVV
jgi:hypothetical protein